MTAPALLVMTTRLPPQVCGIGTYSWLLHQYWPAQSSDVRFLVVDGSIAPENHRKVSSVFEFDNQAGKLASILDRTGPAHLLLHYAGRAYQPFGCPLWLPPVLRRWKAKFPAARIVIFFHELPGGNFPVTSRFFWIDQCNRRVIRQLSEVADAVATNTHEHVRILETITHRTPAHFIPVGSNIEPPADDSGERMHSEFAIFGLPFGRWQTLELFKDEISTWQENGRLTKLHLVGPIDPKFDRRSDRLIEKFCKPADVLRHGMLPAPEVSKLLATVEIGLTNANADNWSKSTAFMAYAAHGCAIVAKTRSQTIPLRFVVSADELLRLSGRDVVERAVALRHWYQENANWERIAQQIAGLFAPATEKMHA